MRKDQNSLSFSVFWIKEKIFNRVFKLITQMLALKDKNPQGLFSTVTIEKDFKSHFNKTQQIHF